MSEKWWTLPGPAEYVSSVVQSIKDGNHVILALPSYVPKSIDKEIKERLGKSWPLYALPADSGFSALDFIYDHFLQGIESAAARSAEELVQSEAIHNRVFYLRLQTGQQWDAWSPFLTDYIDACHSFGRRGPAQFLVILIDEAASVNTNEEALLRVKRWSNITDLLDATLYAALVYQERPNDPLKRRLAIATIAEFSLWDPSIADIFVEQGSDALDRPYEILLDVGRSRGWEAGSQPAWEYGQADFFEGEKRIHSAFLALQGRRDDLSRRIWKAQISVIFPFLEQCRRSIIESANGTLHPPGKIERNGYTRFVESVEDLEFSDLHEQLRAFHHHDSRELTMLRELRSIRNDLAHMKSIDKERLNFPFQSILKGFRSAV